MRTAISIDPSEIDDQGSEYLKYSFIHLQKPISCYFMLFLTPKDAHGFKFERIWSLPNSNLNIVMSRNDLQNKPLIRTLTVK